MEEILNTWASGHALAVETRAFKEWAGQINLDIHENESIPANIRLYFQDADGKSLKFPIRLIGDIAFKKS